MTERRGTRISDTALAKANPPEDPHARVEADSFQPDLNNEDHLRELMYHTGSKKGRLEAQYAYMAEKRKLILDENQLRFRAQGKPQWEAERMGRVEQKYRDHVDAMYRIHIEIKELDAKYWDLQRRLKQIDKHHDQVMADNYRHRR